MLRFSDCYVECHKTECRYAECHYAECFGAQNPDNRDHLFNHRFELRTKLIQNRHELINKTM